jgi:predicted nucleic acid-binding protein
MNLFHIDRLALLGQLTGFEFVVPPEVIQEISQARQAAVVATALSQGFFKQEALVEIPALSLYAELVATLGKGEAACLSLAVTKGWMIASDEKKKFRREVLARIGADRLLNTPGLLLLAIRLGVLSVAEADAALQVLASHRFKVKFKSFRDLLEEPPK